MPDTRERWRNRLPHWEVADRPHFITVRCAGTLPSSVLARIREIHATLSATPSASAQFASLQRQYFLTCEKHLDRGDGFAPFREAAAAAIVHEAWLTLAAASGWQAPHAVVMPNHVHFIVRAARADPLPLRATLRQFKGRVARAANVKLGRNGPFWQSDWFDRWLRDAGEEARVIDYIRMNPVKAGLAQHWHDWPGLISEPTAIAAPENRANATPTRSAELQPALRPKIATHPSAG